MTPPLRLARSKHRGEPSQLVLPQSLEAERAVLGTMLLLGGQATADEQATLLDLTNRLAPEMFYSSDHARIYAILAERVRASKPMDVLGLTDHLMLTGTADTVGGVLYATTLPEHVPTTAAVDHYATIVIDRHKRRLLLQHAADIRQMVYEDESADVIADRLADRAEHLRDVGVMVASDDVPMSRVAADFLSRVLEEKLALREGRITGIPFGLYALDKIGTPGAGELVYFAGRPAMGKTQLMMQVLVNHAQFIARHNLPGVVYICSLEMDRHQLVARLVSSISGVPYSTILNPRSAMDDDLLTRIDRATEHIASLPIVVSDRPARNMASVRRSVHALTRQYGVVHTIGLDYIQLASPEEDAGELRSQQLTQTAYAALTIAREFKSRFFCAVQLNRGVEKRQDQRPVLSDLGESGGLEQAAQWVLMLYRDEYYRPDTPDRGVAEILCRKARNGETQVGRLGFRAGVFADLDERSTVKYGGDF